MAYTTLPVSGWRKCRQKFVHATCNTLAVLTMVTGAAVAFVNRLGLAQSQEKHGVLPGNTARSMDSQHSWVGFATLSLAVVQLAFGLYAFLVAKDVRWRQSIIPSHRFLGAATYLVGGMAAMMGLAQWSAGLSNNNSSVGGGDLVVLSNAAVTLVWSIVVRVLAGTVPGAHEVSRHKTLPGGGPELLGDGSTQSNAINGEAGEGESEGESQPLIQK